VLGQCSRDLAEAGREDSDSRNRFLPMYARRATAALETLVEVMERPKEVQEIVQILGDSLTPAGIEQWLRARNRMLGGRRPLDLIGEGDVASVKLAAKAFVDGAYV
jgi:Protein of unknown function (DUF2384)